MRTQGVENLGGEKCDLAFVVSRLVEEAITAQSMTGDAFGGRDFDDRIFSGGLTVVSEKIVSGRKENVANAEHGRGLETVQFCALASTSSVQMRTRRAPPSGVGRRVSFHSRSW